MPWASALTLATKMSRPPSASAASPIQFAQRRQVGHVDRAAGRLDAVRARVATVWSTASRWRAQIAISQPSAASRLAMAWPMPRVPPVTIAFLPFSPRSMPSPSPASTPGRLLPQFGGPRLHERPAPAGPPPCRLRRARERATTSSAGSAGKPSPHAPPSIAVCRTRDVARPLRRCRVRAPAPTAARGPLANADFRRLWLVGTVASAVRWLEMLVVGVFVYQHTGSAFDVALMTLLRSAADGAVRGGDRRAGRTGRPPQGADRGGAGDAGDLGMPGACWPIPGRSRCGISRSRASATAPPGPPTTRCGGS